MASDGHCANLMMSPGFTELGLAAARSSVGPYWTLVPARPQ